MFFDWFEYHYVPVHHITYPFASIKHACPITTRSKTPTWTLISGPTIESDHPPLRNIQLTHKDQTVDAAPYKLPGEDTLTNTKPEEKTSVRGVVIPENDLDISFVWGRREVDVRVVSNL